MEGSSSKAASDWRSQVSNEFRQKLFKKIFDFMQKNVPIAQSPQGLIQLQNICSQFEEKCYFTATSQADYLRKFSMKMISMEQKYRRTVGSSSTNHGAGNQNCNDPASPSVASPLNLQKQQQSLLQPNKFELSKQPKVQLTSNFQSGQSIMQSPSQGNGQQSQLNSSQQSSPSLAQHHRPVGRQQQNTLASMQRQSNSLQSGMQQQRQFQSQKEHHEGPSVAVDSRVNATNVAIAEVQEEIYQKIKSLKEMHLSELKEFYLVIFQRWHKFQASKPFGQQLEQYEMTKTVKNCLESCIKFLQLSKDKIHPGLKEKLPLFEDRITNAIASHRSKKVVLSEAQGQEQTQQPGKHGQHMPERRSSHISQSHHNNHITQVEKANLHGGSASMQSNLDPIRVSSFGFPHKATGTSLQSNNSSMHPHSKVQQDQNLQLQIHEKQNLMQDSQKQAQLSPHLLVHQRSRFHQLNGGNELNNQQSEVRTSFQTSSPQMLQSLSPQMFHNSSSQRDWSKSATCSQHANSPYIVSSVPNSANAAHQQTSPIEAKLQPLPIVTPGISPSPLLEEFNSPQTSQGNAAEAHLGELSATKRPIEKLVKLIQSLSRETLRSCISDIGTVKTMIDTMAGRAPGNGSRSEVGTDLSLNTWCKLQAQSFMLQDGSSTKKRNRHITSIPLKVSDSCNSIYGLDTYELGSTALSNVKKQRTKVNHSLLEEIKDINRKLMDTVVEIDDDGVVNCSFTAVAFTSDLKSMLSQHQIIPLRLCPSNYPDGSPMFLDELPDKVPQGNEDLHFKIQERFRRSLRCMSHPMSLGEIVRTWDSSIREAIVEYAKKFGGGGFSSTYGGGQKCTTA